MKLLYIIYMLFICQISCYASGSNDNVWLDIPFNTKQLCDIAESAISNAIPETSLAEFKYKFIEYDYRVSFFDNKTNNTFFVEFLNGRQMNIGVDGIRVRIETNGMVKAYGVSLSHYSYAGIAGSPVNKHHDALSIKSNLMLPDRNALAAFGEKLIKNKYIGDLSLRNTRVLVKTEDLLNNGDSDIYNYKIIYLVLNTFKRIKENGTVIVQGEEIVVTWSSSKFRKIINVKIDKRPFLNTRKDPKKRGSKRKWSQTWTD